MAADLRMSVPNRPGSLVKALQALTEAGITVEGSCGDMRPGEKWAYLHVLVADPDPARSVLEEAGIEVTGHHEVELREIEARHGVLAELFTEFSDKGDNIEILYMAADGRWVIGTESMRRHIPGVKVGDARY